MPTEIESAEFESLKDLMSGLPYVGTGYTILKFIYEFGKTNPIQNAIQNILQEINLINTRLAAIESMLDSVHQRIVKGENLDRIRLIREQVVQLSTAGFKIQNNPGDRSRAAEAAHEAGMRADTFLIDDDLWLWSDVRIKAGGVVPVEPDFKPALALPVYSMALSVWISGMLIETGSDLAAIRARYGEQLDRHIAAVGITPGWQDDGSSATTIAEKIRSRITCQPIAVHKFAQNGVCDFTVQCSNDIERKRQVVREFSVEMPGGGPTVLCTINPEVVTLDEQQIEDDDPTIRMLYLWEEILKSISSTGHMPAEPFVGVFPSVEIIDPAVLYLVELNGDLIWRKNYDASQPGGSNKWDGPRTVGTGWGGFKTVFSGGGAAIYAVRNDGVLMWFRHEGFWSGTWNWVDPPHQVGHGWQGFREIFSGGEYIVYGIKTNGDLLWYHHLGGRLGGGEDTWTGPIQVGNGWASFHKVMSGGHGIIYAIGTDGALLRYNHIGYLTGTMDWGYQQQIGTGWGDFGDVVAANNNVLYAFTRDGRILWYKYTMKRRLFPRRGPRFRVDWEGPVEILRFVPGFRTAFTLMDAPHSIIH